MIILAHVIIALSSMAQITYLLIKPSQSGMKVGYALVTATLASGTYLVVNLRTPLASACITGLVYISGISLGLALAHHRLILRSAKI